MTQTNGLFLLAFVAVLTAIGQLCFKKVATCEFSLFRKLLQPFFLFGVFLFMCCIVISSLVARVVDFSIMAAMTSLNYVFVLFLSHWLLKEKIDWPKVLGVFIIIVGLLVMVS